MPSNSRDVYFMISTDSQRFREPHVCTRLCSGTLAPDRQALIASVQPVIVYNNELFRTVALVLRRDGETFDSPQDWPMWAHLLLLRKDVDTQHTEGDVVLNDADFIHLSWVELYPDIESARLEADRFWTENAPKHRKM